MIGRRAFQLMLTVAVAAPMLWLPPAASAQLGPGDIVPNISFKLNRRTGDTLFGSGSVLLTQTNNTQSKRFRLVARNLTPSAIFKLYASNALIGETKVRRNGSARMITNGAQPLPDGVHLFEWTITNAFGPESPRQPFVFVQIDTTAPSPAPPPNLISSDDSGRSSVDNITNQRSVVLTGFADPGVKVQLLINGRPARRVSTFSGTFSGAYTLFVRLKKGRRAYSITQTDGAGNVSAPSPAVLIELDTKSPRPPVITGFGEGTNVLDPRRHITDDTVPTFVGRGTPGDTVELTLDGFRRTTGLVQSAAPFTGIWSTQFGGVLPIGAHTVTAQAIDTAGNTSRQARAFRLEIVPGSSDPAPDSVLVDNFNGQRDPAFDWIEFERAPELANVFFERNDRIEARLGENVGDRAVAGVISDGWALDVTQDFRMRFDFRFTSRLEVFGEQGVRVTLVGDGSTTTGEVFEGLAFTVGRDADGDFLAVDSFSPLSDQPSENGRSVRIFDTGTAFITYDAAMDTISLSQISFGDINAVRVSGVGALIGSDQARISLTGFTDGFAPAISPDDSFLDTFAIEAGALTTHDLFSSGDGVAPLFADNFNDNSISAPDWTQVARDPDIVAPVEQSQRLTFPMAQNNSPFPQFVATSGLLGNAIDLTQPARFRVDWRFEGAQTSFATYALAAGLVFDIGPTTRAVTSGAVFSVGENPVGSFTDISSPTPLPGSGINTTRTRTRGAVYFTYDPATDNGRLVVGTNGYSHEATAFTDLLAQGASAQIYLHAFSSGLSPAVAADDAFFDNLVIDEGAFAVAPLLDAAVDARESTEGAFLPGDVNRDGAVGFDDIQMIQEALGDEGDDLPADIDGDGDVDVNDVRLALLGMGRQPG